MNLQTLRKIHSFIGLFPLGAYLLFHVFEQSPVRVSRDAAIERLAFSENVPLEVLCVLVPLFVHAVLGLVLARRPEEGPSVYASPTFRRFQMTTGVVTALFLVLHVATVWLARVREGRAAAAYTAMTNQVGTLPSAALYVLGTSCVCWHFAHGLSALLLRNAPNLSPRVARAGCAMVGIWLWVIFMDELAAYATGAALL
jgi:succinate dehydrogenase / fumarate reductase, cytochrome b subunit